MDQIHHEGVRNQCLRDVDVVLRDLDSSYRVLKHHEERVFDGLTTISLVHEAVDGRVDGKDQMLCRSRAFSIGPYDEKRN